MISQTSTVVADLLKERWRNLTTAMACEKQAAEEFYSLILDSYQQFFRHYHGLDHLVDCFTHFDEIKQTLTQPQVVEYALWFHDVACVPNSKSNETVSAGVAVFAADQLGLPVEFSRQAAKLILLTNHRETPDSRDEACFLDIDLAVLGREWEGFLWYEKQIRAEYSHLAEPVYRQGRRQVVEQFLGKSSIYQNGYFQKKYEQAARRNLLSLKALLGNDIK